MATKYEWYDSGEYDTNTEDIESKGQTFTVGTVGTNENFSIYSIKLLSYRMGSPGTLTIRMYAVDGSGFPTGSILSSGTIDADTFTTNSESPQLYEILMSPYTLQASTKYAFTIFTEFFESGVTVAYHYFDYPASYAGGDYLFDYEGTWNWEKAFGGGASIYFEVWGNPISSGTNQWINADDTLRQISEAWVNVDDAWRKLSEAWINVDDTFRKLF